LSSIRRINGSLRITNTTHLGEFHYFPNLEEVGILESSSGHRPAIEVTRNEELTSLILPSLRNVFAVNTSTVIIIKENPQLGMKKAEAERYYEAAHGREYVVLEFEDTTTFIDDVLRYKMLLLAALFFIVLILICIAVGLVVTRKKTKHRLVLPQPPYILGKKSRLVLESLVKEILINDPLVWRWNDRELVWGYQIQDAAHADVNVLVMNNETFLNAHMLPLGA
ncbi:hypothetical protein ANCCAN_09799, partial [Ancylostoma caninum]